MNEHFYIPKLNRNSILLFLILTVLIHGVTAHFYKNDDSEFIKERPIEPDKGRVDTSLAVIKLQPFDPNIADIEILTRQGLSKYAAKNLVKLRTTGWRAKRPEDLLRVYGIDSAMLYSIKKRIEFEKPEQARRFNKSNEERRKETKQKPSFDPNTASYQDLLDQGFSKYATNSLQGYLETGARIQTKEDLKRIYGIDESLFLEISDRVKINSLSETVNLDSSISISLEGVILDDFDPNIASLDELLSQGFDRKTAYSLIAYRKKAGFFNDKEQLRRIYGMSDSLFESMESRIQIVLESIVDTSLKDAKGSLETRGDTLVYNLNKVTQEELLTITGIGPYYSKAIFEYGIKLGGYYSVKQLLEVPAFKEEHFEKVEHRFKVDGNLTPITPVAEFKELLQHPYIDYDLAKKFKTMSVFDMEERIQDMINTGQIEKRLVPYLQNY